MSKLTKPSTKPFITQIKSKSKPFKLAGLSFLALLLIYLVTVPLRQPLLSQCPGLHQLVKEEGSIKHFKYQGDFVNFEYTNSPQLPLRHMHADVKITGCSLTTLPKTKAESWYAKFIPADFRYGLYLNEDQTSPKSGFSVHQLDMEGSSLQEMQTNLVDQNNKQRESAQNETRPHRQHLASVANLETEIITLDQQQYLKSTHTFDDRPGTIYMLYTTIANQKDYQIGWYITAPDTESAITYQSQHQSAIESIIGSMYFH